METNNMTTAENITEEQIRALESEAEQAGDVRQAATCRAALTLMRDRRVGTTEWGANAPHEIKNCADAINAARAMED